MSDLEKFLEFYHSVGAHPSINKNRGQNEDQTIVYLGNMGEEDHHGYYGFCSEVVFDREGKWLGQGFWE